VYALAEGRYTPPISSLPLYVLCGVPRALSMNVLFLSLPLLHIENKVAYLGLVFTDEHTQDSCTLPCLARRLATFGDLVQMVQFQFVPDRCVPDQIFLEIASLGQSVPDQTIP
jgi:hypothetical protein